MNGHDDIVQWATTNGCPVNFLVYAAAAQHGNLPMLEWIDEHRASLQYEDDWWPVRHENICASAAASGNIEVLKWCLDKGYSWDSRTCASAASHGHLHVLQWARDKGCPWYEDTCSNAAMWGRFEILKYAQSNGCPWDAETTLAAATHNRLVILKWVQSMGCPWHKRLCCIAAGYCRLYILIWAQLNGCLWSIDDLPEFVRDINTTFYLYCLREQTHKDRVSEFMFQVSLIFKDYLCKRLEREEKALSDDERVEKDCSYNDTMSDVKSEERMVGDILNMCRRM
jgi:hypothetical protein